jgi:hypothetical protein
MREGILMTDRTRLLLAVSLVLPAFGYDPYPATMPRNLVSGTVRFNGAPLPGVTITAYATNYSTVYAVAATDQNGAYQFQLPAWSHWPPTPNPGDNADYHLWASKPGYGFYPSVAPSLTANVTRADHTGDFQGNRVTDIGIYFTVIHYSALPAPGNQPTPGPPLTGADFIAYDGSNPLVSLAATSQAAPDAVLRMQPLLSTDRFTDNQDGTVTDSVTGLVWLKNAGCIHPSLWADALEEVNALASGACGLTDGSAAGQWRLPNVNELESLVDVSTSHPALSPGHPFTNVSPAIYWSSTSYFGGQAGSPSAWAIRFSDGRFINDGIVNSKAFAYNQVWAVRGASAGLNRLQSTGQYVQFADGDDGHLQSGVPLTYPRWLDRSDGTVADTVTGLVWLKEADCIYQKWADALSAVRALSSGQCGLTDGSQPGTWRLPTRAEMESLSDRMVNNHADFFNQTYLNLDGTVYRSPIFNNFMRYQFYWTATSDAADATKAWTVFSCDFGTYDALKNNPGYTLAVRLPQESGPSPRPSGLERQRKAGW